MRARYQRGYLRLGHRKTGPDCWEFLWWDLELTGHRVRRKAVIGTVQQYPNIEEAWQASNGLRVSINEARNRQREQLVTVADLVDHYTRTELTDDPSNGGKSHATKTVYRNFFKRWGIYLNVVGNCKTEASRKPVPLDLTLASELWTWKQDNLYGQPDDWVFASPHSRGRNPYWPDILLTRVVRPAAARAGIQKHIGWHTFRHGFSTMLMANGENVKVVQELMRHANCRCTLEIYSQARLQAKRDAQYRVVEMIIPREREASDARLPLILANGKAAGMALL